MTYEVLARKWRPRRFEDVVGQDHVTQTLINAIKADRLSHAYLFSGPRGVGKTSVARILAKAINCVAGEPGQPCGQCQSCREITDGSSMDVQEIDGASNRGIDEIRDLRESIKDRHVLIVDDIVDTGATLVYLKQMLEARGPASVKTCVLTRKITLLR